MMIKEVYVDNESNSYSNVPSGFEIEPEYTKYGYQEGGVINDIQDSGNKSIKSVC